MARKPYPTDLTHDEWRYLEPHLRTTHHRGRPRRHSVREVINAIFYVLRTGCQWRCLPYGFPPWKTVYHYFRVWRLDGTWKRIHTTIREQLRTKVGRAAQPSASMTSAGLRSIMSMSISVAGKTACRRRGPAPVLDVP